jgi:hypothetical protein
MPIRREVIDEALARNLNERYLDLEATQERFLQRQDADTALATEALADAERDLAAAEEAISRIRSDYKAGKISADDWHDFRGELEEERAGAGAAVERAREQVTAAASSPALSEEQLHLLSQLREFKLGKLEVAPDLNATRTLLRQLYRALVLVTLPSGKTALYPDLPPDAFVVDEFFREHGRLPETPEDWSGDIHETKRVALPLQVSQISDYKGLGTANS